MVLRQSCLSASWWSEVGGRTGFGGLSCKGFLAFAEMEPALEERTVSALEGDDLCRGGD